jgi:membrane-associated protein
VDDILNWVLQTVQSVDPLVRVLLAGFGMFLETSILVGLIVPGDTVVIVAGTAITSPAEYWFLILAVIVGSLSGESLGFWIGRKFGPRIEASWVGRRIGAKNWKLAERYLAKRGGIAVFVSRFLPVLHALIPLTVGTSAMRYRTFLRWTTPACLIWTFAYVTIGTVAAESYRVLADELHYAGFIFAGIIIVFLAVALLIRKILHRSQERHMDSAAESAASSEKSSL